MERWCPQFVLADDDCESAIVSMSVCTGEGQLFTTTLTVNRQDSSLDFLTRNCVVVADGSVIVNVDDILLEAEDRNSRHVSNALQMAAAATRNVCGRRSSHGDQPDSEGPLLNDTWAADLNETLHSLQQVPYTNNIRSSTLNVGITSAPSAPRLRVTDEQVLIENAIHLCLDGFHNLKSTAIQELRVVHFVQDKREAGLLSVRIADELSFPMNYICFLWQYTNSPPKAVCVTLFLKDPHDANPEVLGRCTCGPYSVQNCVHITSCLRNERFVDEVKKALTDRNNSQSLFGSILQPTSKMPLAQLARIATSESGQNRSFLFSLRRTWSFWVTFDRSRGLFVPIMKRLRMAFQCQLCRGSPATRGTCSHEFQARQTSMSNALYDVEDGEGDDNAVNPNFALDEEASNPGQGSSRLDAEVFLYCPTHLYRPVLPCKSEQSMTDVLYQRLRATDSTIGLIDAIFSCRHCNATSMPSEVSNNRRSTETILLTLELGPRKVQMYDWTCPHCQKQNYYSGRHDGVFPVRRKAAYSTDYLYCIVDLVCRLGMSQRTAYEAINVVGRVSRRLLQFESSNEGIDANSSAEERLRNILKRRRVSEALGMFMTTLTLGEGTGQEQLFQCSTCEESMTEVDRNTLGLSVEEANGLKRYRGVVIDGTSCGVLNSLPHIERNCHKVPAPKRVGRKYMITKKCEKKAIRAFLGLAADHMKWLMKDSRNNRNWFWLQPKKGGIERGAGLSFIKVLFRRSECTCFPGETSSVSTGREKDSSHFPSCPYDRFRESHPLLIISDLFQTLFRIEVRTGSGAPPTEDSDADDFSDEDSFDGEEGHSHAEVPVPQSSQEEQQPQQPHGAELLENQLAQDENALSAVAHHDTPQNQQTVAQHQEQPQAGRSRGQRRNDSLKWAASFSVQSPRENGQFIHRLLKLIDFYTLDHLGTVYLTPTPTIQPEIGDGSDPNAEFLEPGRPNFKRVALMKSSEKLHDQVLSSLTNLVNCSHLNSQNELTESSAVAEPSNLVCVACATGVIIAADRIEPTNPILSSLCIELAEIVRGNPILIRCVTPPLIDLVREHMRLAKGLFERFDAIVERPSGQRWRNYYNKFDSVNLPPMDEGHEHEMSYETGIIFPGMKRYRDYIVFESGEQFDCGKRYGKSKFFSPGILTVQCCCSKPQLLGYIIMRKAESTALALSSALCCFKYPPRVIYYDNGCNLLQSMMIRFPAVTKQSKVVIDRFHLKNHTCSPIFNPDSYRRLDADKTTTAESINARIEKTVPFIRYLNSEHLIPFLNNRFALLNIATRYRRTYKKDDLEDEDLWTFFKESISCPCLTCAPGAAGLLAIRDFQYYGIDQNTETSQDAEVGHGEDANDSPNTNEEEGPADPVVEGSE